MPYVSHHFVPDERSGEVPPWGLQQDNHTSKGGQLTTYAWMYRGLEGLPAKPIRNDTTNRFDPKNWRSRSDYREQFLTPQRFSRHQVDRISAFRNNKPHARLEWPLEPNKSYVIWKPQLCDPEQVKAYSAPSLLRHFKQNNWRTTTQSTYQNYFQGKPRPGAEQKLPQINESRSDERKNMESVLDSKGSRRPATEDLRKTPPHLRTTYNGTFVGDEGRPSTNAKPGDYSWRNIKY